MGGLPYDPAEVEARWQARWDADPPPLPAGARFYNLAEFPYPSAEGLHVGHALTYCGVDVVGRYQRMRGRAVFQPMGFDSFGINAENYAMKVGEHPADVVTRTMANYRRQLRRLGGVWDWTGVVTSDSSYYRWTQWLFVRLFHAGLAYQAEAPVMWCPSCATVRLDWPGAGQEHPTPVAGGPARLVDLPPALVGAANPDRPLRCVRPGRRP